MICAFILWQINYSQACSYKLIVEQCSRVSLTTEYSHILVILFQSKYYAKTKINGNMSLILDSDRSVVTLELNSNGVWNDIDLIHTFSIEGIIISLQFLVMVFNLFVLQMASSKFFIIQYDKNTQ